MPSFDTKVAALTRFLRNRQWLDKPLACACCGEVSDATDRETGACLLCCADGALKGEAKSCAACKAGGRTWKPVPDGGEPPVGSAIRRGTHGVEYAQIVGAMLREDA